jgi:hypothetical protein
MIAPKYTASSGDAAIFSTTTARIRTMTGMKTNGLRKNPMPP